MFTVPNAMTVTRLALAPVVGYALLQGAFVPAAVTLAVAGALDFADGWWARRFHATSILGTFLDPLADKVLLACTALPLAITGVLHPALVFVVVGRDVLLVLGSFIHRARTKPAGEGFFSLTGVDFAIEPTRLSKVNTALQIALVAAAMVKAGWGVPPTEIIDAASVLVAGTTIATGFQYLSGSGFAKLPARLRDGPAAALRGAIAARLGSQRGAPTPPAPPPSPPPQQSGGDKHEPLR